MSPLHRRIERATGLLFGAFTTPLSRAEIRRSPLHIASVGPVALGRIDGADGLCVKVGTRCFWIARRPAGKHRARH